MSPLVATPPAQSLRSTPVRLAALTATAAFLLDWATKTWALGNVHDSIMPLGGLTLGVARNDGFAFSSGGGQFSPTAIFTARLLILTTVLYTFRGVLARSRRSAVGLALITAGGFGNAADVMFRDGAVVDFIAAGPLVLSFWRESEPLHFTFVFNLADVAILMGLAMLAPVIQKWAIAVQLRLASRIRAGLRRIYRTTADQLR